MNMLIEAVAAYAEQLGISTQVQRFDQPDCLCHRDLLLL